jgi:hypothetical protein
MIPDYKKNQVVRLILSLGLLMLACQVTSIPTPTPLPPAPETPPDLLNLPATARTLCPDDELIRQSLVALWQHAARPPNELGAIANTGKEIGEIKFCTDVIVLVLG